MVHPVLCCNCFHLLCYCANWKGSNMGRGGLPLFSLSLSLSVSWQVRIWLSSGGTVSSTPAADKWEIGGFMYWEQAYLCCQEAIKREAGILPPTLTSHQWHICRTDSEPWGRLWREREGRHSFPQSVPLTADGEVSVKCWDLNWLQWGRSEGCWLAAADRQLMELYTKWCHSFHMRPEKTYKCLNGWLCIY